MEKLGYGNYTEDSRIKYFYASTFATKNVVRNILLFLPFAVALLLFYAFAIYLQLADQMSGRVITSNYLLLVV